MTETTITVWKDGESPVNLLHDDDKTYLPVPAIAAATGVTKRSLLRDVLIQKNGKIPPGGIEAQIIRWKP